LKSVIRSPVVSDGQVDVIGALAWQAGASTTLSLPGGRARATAQNAGVNPRIFKGPFHTIAGKTYRFHGTGYHGTNTGNFFVRVSTDNTIQNDGPIQANDDLSGNPLLVDGTWTAGQTIDLYLGLVVIVSAIGQYAEIDDNFSIIQL
jgi:hypothetical protein